jgi:hypothetical protein
MKFVLILILFISNVITTSAQSVTYKSNKWGNTKLYNSFTKAIENPVLENVTIVQGRSGFRVTFGNTEKLYAILTIKAVSELVTEYKTIWNDKTYLITTMYSNGEYTVICKDEWVVTGITEMSSSE